jgi:uncharacterized membrane protein
MAEPVHSKDTRKTLIVKTLNEEKPKTINELVTLINKKYGFSEQEIFSLIMELNEEKKIKLTDKSAFGAQKTVANMFSQNFIWYWVTLLSSFLTALAVFLIPDGVYPAGYLRLGLGAEFVAFLPGFVLTKSVLTAKFTAKNLNVAFDSLDIAAFSLGLSIAIVAITCLLLNYSPLGLTLNSVTLTLLVFTLVFGTFAARLQLRQH